LKRVRHWLGALDEKFRALGNPGMIESEVVWNEVEEKFYAEAVEALAKLF